MNNHMLANILMTAQAMAETYDIAFLLDLKVARQIGNLTIDLREHPIDIEGVAMGTVYGIITIDRILDVSVRYDIVSCVVQLNVGNLDHSVMELTTLNIAKVRTA